MGASEHGLLQARSSGPWTRLSHALHLDLAQMFGLWHIWHALFSGTDTPRQGALPFSYSLKAAVRESFLGLLSEIVLGFSE